MFWLVRLVTFVMATVSLVVAADMTSVAHSVHYQRNVRKYSKKMRIIAWCISTMLCIATIFGIIFTNYNEWTLMKVATCFYAWFAFLEYFYEESVYYKQDRLTNRIYTTAKLAGWLFVLIAMVGVVYGITYEYPSWQETQRLSTTELVAANDSYQTEGRGGSGLNQDVLDSSIISTWYELYVPAGSVIESYSFDLQ